VLDYKVTANSQNAGVENGLKFQLPLYLKIVDRLKDKLLASGGFDHAPNPVQVRSGVYVRLDTSKAKVMISPDLTDPSIAKAHFDGKATNRNSYRRNENDVERLTSRYLERAADIIVAIEQGKFHPTGVDDTPCTYCDYNRVCPAAGQASRFHDMGIADGVFPQETKLLETTKNEAPSGDEE
jgi:ATP-dependent helicase/DNAse subunit B